MRPLGIPTVLDRFIQQAVMQVLQRDGTGRSPSTASASGRGARRIRRWRRRRRISPPATLSLWISTWRSSDRVNHDKLMGLVAQRVADKRIRNLTAIS